MNKKTSIMIAFMTSMMVVGCSKSVNDNSNTLSNDTQPNSGQVATEQTTATTITADEAVANTTEEIAVQKMTVSQGETTQDVPEPTFSSGDDIATPSKKEGMGNVTFLNGDTEIEKETEYSVVLFARDEDKAYSEYYEGYTNNKGVSLKELLNTEGKSDRDIKETGELQEKVNERISSDEEGWLISIGAKNIKKFRNFLYEITISGIDIEKIRSGRCNYDIVARKTDEESEKDITNYYGTYDPKGVVYASPLSSMVTESELSKTTIQINEEYIAFTAETNDVKQYAYDISSLTSEAGNVFGFDAVDFGLMDNQLQEQIAAADGVLVINENFKIILCGKTILVDEGTKEIYQFDIKV